MCVRTFGPSGEDVSEVGDPEGGVVVGDGGGAAAPEAAEAVAQRAQRARQHLGLFLAHASSCCMLLLLRQAGHLLHRAL